MLLKRIITLLIAIPLVTSLIYWGSERVFFLLIIITAAAALSEFYGMNIPDGGSFIKACLVITGLLCIYFVECYQHFLDLNFTSVVEALFEILFISAAIIVFFALVIKLILFPRRVILQKKIYIAIIGIIYICLFLSYFLLLRKQPAGKQWVFFTLIVLWMGDTGAYIVGNLWGKIKLCPQVSPNKTVEGAIGGLLFCLLAGVICQRLFLSEYAMSYCLVLSLVISLAGQLGDNCESVFKREHNLKDSGNILPGHGGILDRIDSLLFAAPFVYYYNILLLQ